MRGDLDRARLLREARTAGIEVPRGADIGEINAALDEHLGRKLAADNAAGGVLGAGMRPDDDETDETGQE